MYTILIILSDDYMYAVIKDSEIWNFNIELEDIEVSIINRDERIFHRIFSRVKAHVSRKAKIWA